MTLHNPSPEDIGKAVADRLCTHVESLPDHADIAEAVTLLARLAQAEAWTKLRRGEQFNLVRADASGSTLGVLHYPGFSDDPFPSLAASWSVDLDTGSVGDRTYADLLNPPILHRKELLLPEDDPRREVYAALTAACESIGLFDDPRRIGCRRQWDQLARERGYRIVAFSPEQSRRVVRMVPGPSGRRVPRVTSVDDILTLS